MRLWVAAVSIFVWAKLRALKPSKRIVISAFARDVGISILDVWAPIYVDGDLTSCFSRIFVGLA